MTYKDKFKAQMKKAGINSLDDLKTDAEKKAFFKAVDKSHDAVNEELLTIAEELKEYTGMSISRSVNSNQVATTLKNLEKGTKLHVMGKPQNGMRTMGDVISISGDTVKIKPTAANGPTSVKVKDITFMDVFKEETINEFKLKDSDIEKLKQGVKQMPPIKGAKLGKPEKVKAADEAYTEMAMQKEMMKKEMMKKEMMKAQKTGDDDLSPDAVKLNAMVKDPHKSAEDKPMKDMNAMYMKSDVRADVKNNGGADMAKVKDKAEMMYAMKKINAMYKEDKYLPTKEGSINDAVAQMQMAEQKTVTVRVKEFSQMVETYLARGGVKGFINAELTEGKQVLPLKEVRTFIDTYNRHFLTNYRAEEFIVRDRLAEQWKYEMDIETNDDGDMILVHGNISASSESQAQAKFDKLEREMEKKYGEGSVEGGVFKNANTHTSGRGPVTRKNI